MTRLSQRGEVSDDLFELDLPVHVEQDRDLDGILVVGGFADLGCPLKVDNGFHAATDSVDDAISRCSTSVPRTVTSALTQGASWAQIGAGLGLPDPWEFVAQLPGRGELSAIVSVLPPPVLMVAWRHLRDCIDPACR